MSLRRMRSLVREDRYEFTLHALEEMDEEDLSETDVRNAILNGHVNGELTDDPRGKRYVVRYAAGTDAIEVVCRFLPSGILRIITVYMVE